MTKEYNNWYWRLYRWFKWEFPYLHINIYKGIKNLIKWAPIIWKDRDWDYSFTFKILKFKIENIKQLFEENQKFEGYERNVELMNVCIKLLDNISNDVYGDEYMDYYESELLTEYNENGTHSINFKTVEDRTDEYIDKYPHAKRVLFTDPRWERCRDNQTGKCLAVGQIRHEKAIKLLFRILEEKIEGWWQ